MNLEPIEALTHGRNNLSTKFHCMSWPGMIGIICSEKKKEKESHAANSPDRLQEMHSHILVLGGLLATAKGATNTSWVDVKDCLRNSKVPFDEHGSVDWIRDAAAYNVRLPIFTPAAIAVPTTIPQIQAAVICGNQSHVKVSAKAGGHSYTGGGFGGESGHLIVQLDRMVGASGHMTSGGYGMSSHTHGLALDFVKSATVVLANGSAVETSATENPDLFWAIRGAGPNFGIVVSWRLQTFETPVNLTWFRITLDWNRNTAAGYLGAVEKYINTDMPAELNFRIADYDKGHPFAEGLFYGNDEQMNSTIQPFLKISNGNLMTHHQVNWIDAIKHYSVDNTFNTTANNIVVDYTEPGPPDNFFAKSLTLNGLNGAAAKAFVDYWYGTANKVERKWFFQIDAAGGPNSAYRNPPGNNSSATSSFAHRDKTFIIQFYDAAPAGNLAYPPDGLSFLNGWVDTVTAALGNSSSSWGAYANYPDPTLGRDEAQRLYYGASLERLRELKLKYDPGELFSFPQSIKPSEKQPAGSRRRH
ncbi:hypothetical protein PG993_012443 [Apiospora rasikravindrae]|uniref:Berberine/berberine-like domain-containing protein n=1 Tax=Apiospora rasikravindrae TaxID=990691 RepID=A0ABR1S2I3_9PEZI